MKSQIGKKLCMGGKKAMILPSVKISKVHECLVEGFHLTGATTMPWSAEFHFKMDASWEQSLSVGMRPHAR